MKILYININNGTVNESDGIEVIKPDSGSLLNDFLYTLGEIITEGVPNDSGFNLVKLFTNADGYDDYVSQWKAIEPLLFAEEPVSGKRDISIPDKYLHWLRHQNIEVLQDIYEAIKDREAITIDLENFYDDSIGELQAKIVRHLKKDTSIEAVQFSSPLVTSESQIVRYLNKRFDSVAFVPYKNNNKECDLCSIDRTQITPNICRQIYAKKISYTYETNVRIMFYTETGIQLDGKEYILISQQIENKYGIQSTQNNNHSSVYILKNCLLTSKEDGSKLFYISPDGQLYSLGEYSYKTGYRIGQERERSQFNYDVEIRNNNILYKHNDNYKLYQIVNDRIVLRGIFSMKSMFIGEDFWINMDNYFMTRDHGIIDLRTANRIEEGEYEYLMYLGKIENASFFCGYNFVNGIVRSAIISSKGGTIKQLNENTICLPIPDTGLIQILEFPNTTDGFYIATLKGNPIKNIKYKSWQNIGNDILRLDAKEKSNYYMLKWHCFAILFSENYYCTYSDFILSFYSRENNNFLYKTRIEGFDEINEIVIKDVYGTYTNYVLDKKTQQIFSLKSRKYIYTIKSNEVFLFSNKLTFFSINDNKNLRIYNLDGCCIHTISNVESLDYLKLWDNGYISFYDKEKNMLGFFDADFNKHMIYFSKNISYNHEDSYIIEIKSEAFIYFYTKSEDCSLIARADNYCVIDNEMNIIYKGEQLEKIDERNYLGRPSEKRHGKDPCIILDSYTGNIVVRGKENEIYLIK